MANCQKLGVELQRSELRPKKLTSRLKGEALQGGVLKARALIKARSVPKAVRGAAC
jgi:hypothetical protein